MNIRNLFVIAITMSFGTLYAAAQYAAPQTPESVTFTDEFKRSITISRFGTVLSFQDSNGKEVVPTNAYRVCLCGEKSPCVESATLPSKETTSRLEVEFPKKGTTLKKGETLVVTATYRQAELTVTRHLTWEAGSSSVKTEEVISAAKPLCFCTFEDIPVLRMEKKMCPRPPGDPGYWLCPPYTEVNPNDVKQVMVTTFLVPPK